MAEHNSKARPQPAFLFDLDGTLMEQSTMLWILRGESPRAANCL